jgi:outer membrane protein assembly factor BamD
MSYNIKKILFFSALLLVPLLFLSGCGKYDNLKEGEEGKFLYEDGLALYKKKKYSKAIVRFKKILEDYPFGPYVADSTLFIADSFYFDKKYEDAANYYGDFVSLHPDHLRAPYAQYQKGMSFYKDTLTIDRDQTSTKKAISALQELKLRYQASSYREQADDLIKICNNRLAERELYISHFYIKNKNYKGAISRLQDMLEDYPESDFSDEALFNLGSSYLKVGEIERAKKTFSILRSSYPDSEFTKDLDALNLDELESSSGETS